MSEDTMVNALLSRRSVLAKCMQEPGPSEEQLATILEVGHRVPDHGKLGPWRFIIFQGDARKRFGKVLRNRFAEQHPEAVAKNLETEQDRFLRAPLVIGVVSSVVSDHKVPVWEQELSAGAACQNILHAASAMGYGAQWLTEWYAFDEVIDHELALTADEKIAGFIYIGTMLEKPKERVRPELSDRVSYY